MAEVKRYTPMWNYGVMGVCDGGEFVQVCDYARLLDRVAELERERDELREWNAQLDAAATKLSLERDDAQAELARLRAVEKAAKAMIEAGLADIDDAERAYDALAEACGRNG